MILPQMHSRQHDKWNHLKNYGNKMPNYTKVIPFYFVWHMRFTYLLFFYSTHCNLQWINRNVSLSVDSMRITVKIIVHFGYRVHFVSAKMRLCVRYKHQTDCATLTDVAFEPSTSATILY